MAVLVRAVVSWLFAMAWTLFVATSAVFLAVGNFILSYDSFKAQGFSGTPLRHLPFVGEWAEGFGAGSATGAAMYGFVLTLVMNVALIGTAKKIERAIQLVLDLRQASRSTDPATLARVAAYRDRAVHDCVVAAALVLASIGIVLWDVSQFNFNYVATFDPGRDAADVVGWAPDLVQHVGEFVAELIRRAKWGYVGCLVAIALILEDAIIRTGHTWVNVHNALDEVVAPALPLQTEQADQEPVEDVVGREYNAGPAFAGAAVFPSSSGNGTEATADSSGRSSYAGADPPSAAEADAEPISPPPSADSVPPMPPREEPMVEVFVGPGRIESIPFAEVQADSTRFVRDGSGRAWFDRAYWEDLTGSKASKGVGR